MEKKISELTSATNVNSNDSFILNQGSQTKKVSMNILSTSMIPSIIQVEQSQVIPSLIMINDLSNIPSFISIADVSIPSEIIVNWGTPPSLTAEARWTLGANGTTDYTFTGVGFVSTTNDPVLYLARGRVYEFVNNTGHPFEIRVSNGGSAYNNGVVNNGASSGIIRFEVPFNAPNTLYYQCTSHSGMGNVINIYPSI